MVSLAEILEHAGYDIVNNKEDMQWFMSRIIEFGDLVEEVECRLDEIRDMEYEELERETNS